jgi:hypothetical protein
MLDRDADILDQMRTRSSFLLAALALGGKRKSASRTAGKSSIKS